MNPLTWTSERPTEPGWYWMRKLPFLDKPKIVLIRLVSNGSLFVKRYEASMQALNEFVTRHRGCQWAGPIPDPQELPR